MKSQQNGQIINREEFDQVTDSFKREIRLNADASQSSTTVLMIECCVPQIIATKFNNSYFLYENSVILGL